MWNEVSGPSNLITTANFCNNGKYAVVGTYDGKCIFFTTEVNWGCYFGICFHFFVTFEN